MLFHNHNGNSEKNQHVITTVSELYRIITLIIMSGNYQAIKLSVKTVSRMCMDECKCYVFTMLHLSPVARIT